MSTGPVNGEDGLSRIASWLRARCAKGGWRYWLAANTAVAASYFVLGAVVSWFFAAYGVFPAPIWLPAAVAVVAAIAEMRLVPGIFLGSLMTNAVLFAAPAHLAAMISLTNALGPLAAAVALRRLRPAGGLFTSFGGVLRFLLCAMVLHPAITATGGAVAMAIGHPFNWLHSYTVWLGWWLCDAGGTLYLAPALLLWLGLEDTGSAHPADPRLDRRNLLVWAAVAVFTAALFLTPPLHGNALRPALPFLLIMPLSWVALRMSLRSAYTLILVVAAIAAAGTAAGLGAFNDPGIANPLRIVGLLVVILAMDVLTTVALVSELHQARHENRVKSMFLATTSHELRSPLNAIIGFSSMIGSEAAGPIGNPKYAEYAQTIQAAGEHLLGLINGLLDLAKIEADQFPLSEERMSLADAVEEAFALLRFQAAQKSVALGREIAPDAAAIHADPSAMRRILLNLLGNAVKFTPAGGRVELAAWRGPAGELNLAVRDTGIGIPADRLERVFLPFERVPAAGRTVEGTGLGLSITRGLVELHGGTIRLESEEGRGTTALVTLPSARVLAPDSAEPGRLAEAAE